MHLWIKECDRLSTDSVRTFVENCVESKLSRFSKMIRSFSVTLRDVNGPRGGVDHSIQIVVRLISGAEVVIRHQAVDVYTGMPVAIDRTVQAVKRELQRRRSLRRQAARPKHVAQALS
jgi:ribosome-associated translation inhibitor RaiA